MVPAAGEGGGAQVRPDSALRASSRSRRSANREGGRLQVVLFSGGRGSGALARELVSSAGIDLTLAINGYDDGASTGDVRRFLGDSLGPSDFRKNASTLAGTLQTCAPAVTDVLDLRLPATYTEAEAIRLFDVIAGTAAAAAGDAFAASVVRLAATLDPGSRQALHLRLQHFAEELASGRSFPFGDCSVGNLVFAGGYLACARDFNRAVDDYCALVGLSAGVIENVTDGTNAYLIGIEADGRLLATEEEIVDPRRPNRIKDIYLLDRPLTDVERETVEDGGVAAEMLLRQREPRLMLNARLASKIAAADLIIYAPGTQHSSLFPSYLTPGLGEAIADNLAAMKLLITNIQSDAEITGTSAIEIVDRAVYYLKNKGRAPTPTPFLITHCLLNDPAGPEAERPYVPLGPTDTLEDPRLIRIGNYEDGVTGRHDAARVLAPFVASIAGRHVRRNVAVLLHDADSINKVTQTLLEMVRGGIGTLPVDVTVFYPAPEPLAAKLASKLPFSVRHLARGERGFADAARSGAFEYVLLFESSGMYRGEETVPLLSQLAVGRLDAVWGSRRLSVRDIEESYRFRYRRNVLLGAISYVGSHILSLACLLLYGRYVTDTLSGVRAIRAADALDSSVDLTDKNANHVLLSHLLRRKAEILEMPVRFFPLSPDRVKRTSALDGLRALATLFVQRFTMRRGRATDVSYASDSATPAPPLK